MKTTILSTYPIVIMYHPHAYAESRWGIISNRKSTNTYQKNDKTIVVKSIFNGSQSVMDKLKNLTKENFQLAASLKECYKTDDNTTVLNDANTERTVSQ